jgi:hypothetical protein
MKTIPVPSNIFQWSQTSEEATYLNNDILRIINERPFTPLKSGGEQLSNQDWNNFDWEGNSAPYMELLRPIISNYLVELMKLDTSVNNDKPLEMLNYWFQQYGEGDYHSWHHHINCTYSSTYFVEVPDGCSTTFRTSTKEFQIPVKNGDYIVFPSHLSHCSKPNYSRSLKTIVSINLSAAARD